MTSRPGSLGAGVDRRGARGLRGRVADARAGVAAVGAAALTGGHADWHCASAVQLPQLPPPELELEPELLPLLELLPELLPLPERCSRSRPPELLLLLPELLPELPPELLPDSVPPS